MGAKQSKEPNIDDEDHPSDSITSSRRKRSHCYSTRSTTTELNDDVNQKSVGHRRLQRTQEVVDFSQETALKREERPRESTRLSPPCVVPWTLTPDDDSQTLSDVSHSSSMSDSEASTPVSSPISLHAGRDIITVWPEAKEEIQRYLNQQEQAGASEPELKLEEKEKRMVHNSPLLIPFLQPPLLSNVLDAPPRCSPVAPSPVHTSTGASELLSERNHLQALGDCMEKQGQLIEALHLYERCYNLDEMLPTLSIDDVAVTHLKIGIVYWKMSSHHDSKNTFNYVLSLYEDKFGPQWLKHTADLLNATALTLSETYLMLGRSHLSLGESEEAKYYVKQSLSILEASHLEDDEAHPIFARGLHSLGLAYEACGLYSKAMKNYHEAVDMQREFYGDSHVDVAATLASIGSLHEKSGTNDKAMTFFVEALHIYENQSGEESCQVDIGFILSRIGWICFLEGHDQAAMEAYAESLDYLTAVLGEVHRNVASILVEIGMVHQKWKRANDALASYMDALEIQRQSFGSEIHRDIAITLVAMAESYSSIDEPERAITVLDRALEIRRQLFGKRHIDVGNIFATLGDLYKTTKREPLARQCYGNALKIYKANRACALESNVRKLLLQIL